MKESLSVHIRTAKLPLRSAFVTAGWAISSRHVMLVELRAEDGLRAFGESAPLPALGTETFDRSLEALRGAAHVLTAEPIGPAHLENFDSVFPCLEQTPCARFAVETALLDLFARRNGLPLARFLVAGTGGQAAPVVRVNAVLTEEDPLGIASRCRDLAAKGYRCLKIKVGVFPLAVDVERVAAAREASPDDTLIRLDANGKWSIEEARTAIHVFRHMGIEYIEQPIPAGAMEALRRLKSDSPIPIAADESAHPLERARVLLVEDACDLFILKPMAAGTLVACRSFAREAHAAGKAVVFTTMIDGPVARSAVAHLAASIPSVLLRHHGLSTGGIFPDDPLERNVRDGQYFLGSAPGIGFDAGELIGWYPSSDHDAISIRVPQD
ncbi:MAG: o-succinylbenzoate synthase [Bacteroidota bacterium]|nr:o-succinylbenzoate synthase [Bacteroidota bacterium]